MTTEDSRLREKVHLLCPVCKQIQRTEGWLTWHISKYHPEYIDSGSSPAPAMDMRKLIEERKQREEAVAERGAVVWKCIGCGELSYDIGVVADSPGLEVRKTTYCLSCIRGWRNLKEEN